MCVKEITCRARQTTLGGLLIFIALIALSMMLGVYGLYIERTSTNTSPTNTSPITTESQVMTNATTSTPITAPTNTTTEHPYQPA
ncbi:MAG: hypothetical protein QXM76_05490 [Zestosphaera sp.]